MRLTLRTLLAYLDDRLSPAHARELGQKVSNSPFATELAERIRDVLRRRRLASDTAGRKTIDANLVAEYLDDQLTPELVALIEREILASDHSLAEVAASHQILGLLNDPVDLEPGLRRRLLAMAPSSATEETAEGSGTSTDQVPEWQPLAPTETASRRSPLALLLIMVLGWLVLLATDSHLFQKTPPQSNVVAVEDPVNGDPVAPAVAAPADPETVAANDSKPTPKASGEGSTTTTAEQTSVVADTQNPDQSATNAAKPNSPDNESSEEPAELAAASQPKPNEMAPGDRAPDDATSSAPTTVAMANANESTAPEIVPTVPDAPTVDADSTTSVVSPTDPKPATTEPPQEQTLELYDPRSMLLMADVDAGRWTWVAKAAPLADGNWKSVLTNQLLAVPSPFRAEMIAPESGWRATILSGSLVRVVDADTTGLALVEGRLLIRSSADNPEATIPLRVGSTTFRLTVPQGDAVVAVAVQPRPSESIDEGDDSFLSLIPDGHDCDVFIHAVGGDAQLQRADSEPPATVADGYTIHWLTSNSDGEEIAKSIPEWVFEASVPAADATQKTFDTVAEILHSGSSLFDGMNALSKNRNPELASWSAKIPALLRSVDDLISFLIESEQGVVRQEAARGLTSIAQQSPLGREHVKRALENRLSEVEMKNAMRLVDGVTRTAAEDPETSRWLVDMLSDNRLAFRELAIFNLEQIVGDRNGYFADDDRRSTAIRRWTRLLEKNDGRLVKPVEE